MVSQARFPASTFYDALTDFENWRVRNLDKTILFFMVFQQPVCIEVVWEKWEE